MNIEKILLITIFFIKLRIKKKEILKEFHDFNTDNSIY
jgi:hypothetical protein